VEFHLGTIRKVKVQFSGGLTPRPEWFATKSALVGEFRVAMIVRCPLSCSALDADVQAYLRYDPGFWHKADIYTQQISIPLVRESFLKSSDRDGPFQLPGKACQSAAVNGTLGFAGVSLMAAL
jgi:hypothetical protein